MKKWRWFPLELLGGLLYIPAGLFCVSFIATAIIVAIQSPVNPDSHGYVLGHYINGSQSARLQGLSLLGSFISGLIMVLLKQLANVCWEYRHKFS